MDNSHPLVFEELLILLVGSLVSVVVFRRLNLPDVLAYLLAGAVIGPHGAGWVPHSEEIGLLSDLGLVFLLFELGLEFSPARLRSISRAVFGLGSLQVGGTIAAFGSLAFYGLGLDLQSALVVGGAFSLSSTAIVVRELRLAGLANRHHAQLAIGVLIFQDLAAVAGLILVEAFGRGTASTLATGFLLTLGKGALLVAILVGSGKWLLPRLFREVTKARSEEVFVLTVLLIILLSAWLTREFGLSMALGAFLTGVMLGEGEFRYQVEADIRPFKDVLMGLFFAAVGMQIDVSPLTGAEGLPIIAGIALLIVVKTMIAGLGALILREPLSTALKTGLILAQASEFGFALIILARKLGVVSDALGSSVLLISTGSLILAPLLIRHSFEISRLILKLTRRNESAREREFTRVPEHLADHVIIAGWGRVGTMVGRCLAANGIPFVAMDTDPHLVKRARAAGHPVIYGSCQRVELLKRCHMERARLAILTLRSMKDARRVVSQIREQGYRCTIVVRTGHDADYAELLAAGADYVVPEMLESGLAMAAEVLHLMGIPKAKIDEQIVSEREAHLRPVRTAARP